MLRRRLACYVLMFCLGISAGYVGLERLQLVGCAGYLLCIGLVLGLITEDDIGRRDRGELRQLWVMVLTGFLMFTASYIYYYSDGIPENNTVEGTVVRIKSSSERLELVIAADEPAHSRIIVTRYDPLESELEGIHPGDIIEAQGQFRKPKRQVNPHTFDYGLYLMSSGIRYSFSADRINVEGVNRRLWWRYRSLLYDRRCRFLKLFDDDSCRATVKGVVFGDKSEIDEETRLEFNSNATGHILAVSGLHIGFLLGLLRRLTRKRNTLMMRLAIIIVIMMYGEMTMWSASTIRAVLVVAIRMLAMHVRRPFDLLSAVSASAAILLAGNPYQLFNSGFQMSYIAMLGIVFLYPFLESVTGDYMGMLLAVQLAIAPYTIVSFHRFNVLSMLINIPVVFIASAAVPVSIAALIIVSLTGDCPSLLLQLIEGMNLLLTRVNHLLYFDGAFSNRISSRGILTTIIIYITVVLLSSEWSRIRLLRADRRSIARMLCLSLCPCIVAVYSMNSFDRSEVVMVSVGQGDCTHISSGSTDILIDGGGSPDTNIGEKVLEPYLLGNGVSDIDMALVTHLHMDHYKGIEELSACYPVKEVVIPDFYSSGVLTGVACSTIAVHDRIRAADDVTIEAIWPISESVGTNDMTSVDRDDFNELNMVYRLDYRGVVILITGDLPDTEEEKLVSYYRGTDKLDCDVLKVAHHGSRSSTTDCFLDAAAPEAAIISVGEGNRYGHPTQECLDRLSSRGIPVYRTDIQGAVGIDIGRGGEYSIRTML